MAWQPPEDELDRNLPPQWQPPEDELDIAKQWQPPEDELDNSPTKIKDVGTLQQMKSSGQPLTREQERILWDADEAKPLTQKASEAITTFVPTAINIAKQLGTGAGEFIYKGILKPIDTMSQSPEEAAKTFKDAGNVWRSAVHGVAQDIQETADTGVRFAMFGSSITDSLLGKSKDEKFERYMLSSANREFAQKVYEDNPDAAARLLSENPILQNFAYAAAIAQGGTEEEAELAKVAYSNLVKESGLTKDEINENVALFGEVISPLSLPGTNTATKFLSKGTSKVVQKSGELALRGIAPVAKKIEQLAGGVESLVGKTENLSRKIGEYTVGDPDTLVKNATTTVLAPVKIPAKMTRGIARTVADVAGEAGKVGGTAGRRGIFERAGRSATAGDLTRKLFGPEALGGKGRARVADWTVRQANAIAQPAVNGAVLNVVMGLPDIESASDIGFMAGVGAGIGGYGGARLPERAYGLIDPTTSLAQKIDTLITPDPEGLRRDQDADIKRFLATADISLLDSINDLSSLEKIKGSMDVKIKNLEGRKTAQIRDEDAKRIQIEIDNLKNQRKALDKSTPQTEAEIKRQIQLSFADAMDLAKTTGAAAGLNNIQVKVLRPDQMEQFYRDLYGKTLTDAESVVSQLLGNPNMTEQEAQMFSMADQTVKSFLRDVAGASIARGFAISENSARPEHLRYANQKGATVVINGDLVTQMGRDGLNLSRVINHEIQHGLSSFEEVRQMLAPMRRQLFDQKIQNPDGTFETVSNGSISDAQLDAYAIQYAAAMDASGGASFLGQFANQEQLRVYMKEEVLSELAGLSGASHGDLRGALDSAGRQVVDWLEVKSRNGALKKLKEGLRRFGVLVDDQGQFSSVLGADLAPEALASMRQYQRKLRDLNESMVFNSDPQKDAPEITLTQIATNRVLQERYKHSEFFAQQQVVTLTTPDGKTQEIVVPPDAKLDKFISEYRFQGGQLVDADGNPVSLGPDIPLQAMPDGTVVTIDTRIARNADGSPQILSPRESKRRAKKRGEEIRKAIDDAPDDASGLRLEDMGNGNYRGTLSPAQIEAVNALPNDLVAPSLKRKIAFFNDILGRKDGSIAEIEYQAALRDGKYRALQPQLRTEIPIGFQFDKQGNFLMTTMSMSRMHDKANAWAAKSPKNLRLWGGDMTKFWDSVRQYLHNHKGGLQGHIGLNPDPEIAMQMKNRINDLFNVYRKETREANPERTTLPKRRGQDSRDVVIRSRRMDRINSYDETALPKMPFQYELAVQNYLPAENPFAEFQSAEQFAQSAEVNPDLARRAIGGDIEPLELQLHEQDILRPAEYVDVRDGEIRVRSMFDPTQNVFIPGESESDTPEEISRAKRLSSELEEMYAAGGTDLRINEYESELEQIYQQLESQAQEQDSETYDFAESPETTEVDTMNAPTEAVLAAIDAYRAGRVDNESQTLAQHIRSFIDSSGSLKIPENVTDQQIEAAANDAVQYRESLKNRIRSSAKFSNAVVAPPGIQFLPGFHRGKQKVEDSFQLKYVGKGTGKQAYGWGLYFGTDERVVDKQYPFQFKYKVDLDLTPEEAIDWDAPIDPRLQEDVDQLIADLEADMVIPMPQIFTNGDYYEALSEQLMDPKEASMKLLERGIPAIRFLDERSRFRTAPQDWKYNYVVFDESKIRILDETDTQAGPVTQFMPAVAAVPERFTGKPEDERRGRYVAPPAFFQQFDIGEYERGGKFFDIQTGEDVTDKVYATGTIDVTGKSPSLVSDVQTEQLGEGKTWKTNLFKKSAGWNWISENPPEVASIGKKEKPDPVLVSVENGKDHFYALKVDFPTGVKLQRYSDKPSEPRLRPTAKGEVQFGNEIGRIKTAKKEHPVYDTITIGQQFMPADSEYLDLAQDPKKNREQLQRMVNETAKTTRFLIEAQHRTPEQFSVFSNKTKPVNRKNDIEGFYFSPIGTLGYSGKNLMRVFLPENLQDISGRMEELQGDGLSFSESKKLAMQEAIDAGAIGTRHDGGEYNSPEFYVASPNQIKSADPVTYDDAGNVIPLSQRFQTTSPDIRFMPPEQEGMEGVEPPKLYPRTTEMIRPLQGVEPPAAIAQAQPPAPPVSALPKKVEKTMKADAGDFSVVIGGKPGKYGFGYTTVADLAPKLELSQDRKKYLIEALTPRNDQLNKKRDALLAIGNLYWENIDIKNKEDKSQDDIQRSEEIGELLNEFMENSDRDFTLNDAAQVAEVDRLTRSINLMNRGMVPAPFKFPVDNREVPTPVEKPVDISPDASKEDKAKYAKELAAHEAYIALVKKQEQDVNIGLKSLQSAVATLFKTKKFKEFIAEAVGLNGIQFDNILGTWKFEPEPSFVFSAQDMTWEQAQLVTKWLSVLMTQDAGIAWKPSIGLTEGAPSVYLVHDKKLTDEQILNAFKKAKEVGIDGLSVTVDGKGIKAANFDGIDGFGSKLVEIQKAANIKNFHDTLVDSFYYDTTSDFTADDGSLKVPDWLKGESINEENIQNQQGEVAGGMRETGRDTTTSGFPILLRRGIDSVLIPFAKALAGEGFTFDPDRFAERYGLSQEVADYIREQLYPTTGLSRSVTSILDGTEKFTVPESYYTKGGRLKTSVNDLMYALQKRSADDGFIQPGDYSTRAGQIVAETIVDEIEGHMERAAKNPEAPNAIGWYDTALKKMKQKYSQFFPFLNRGTPSYDADKEFVFDCVLGIASQGNNVFENGKMAARVQFLLESGKTLPEIENELYGTFGGETRAIENNLLKLDELIKNNGIQALDKLFRKKMTVSEWNSYFKKNKNLWFKGKPLSVDGQADQMVTGFSVFGPKIGSFINNLHGDYSTLTADLWFTRTWNRILGNVFQHAPLKEANQFNSFRKTILEQYRSDSAQSAGEKFEPLLKKVNKDGEKEFFDYMQEPELDGISRDNLDKLLTDPQKMLEFATALEDRYRKGQYKAKSDLRRAAKNWVENRTDPVAAPRTDLERDFQQDVMEIAQKKLRRKGINITIADMQAALWYNEKELFGLYGAQVSGSEPADYADAADNVDEIMAYASLFKVNRLVEVDGKMKSEIVRLLTPDEEVALTGIKNAKTPEQYVALLAARKKAEDDENAAEKKLEIAELKVAKSKRELVAATDEKSKQKIQAALEKAQKILADLKPPVAVSGLPLTGIESPIE